MSGGSSKRYPPARRVGCARLPGSSDCRSVGEGTGDGPGHSSEEEYLGSASAGARHPLVVFVDQAVHRHRRTVALFAVVGARNNSCRGHSASGAAGRRIAVPVCLQHVKRKCACGLRCATAGASRPSLPSRERDSAAACGAEFVWQQDQWGLRHPRGRVFRRGHGDSRSGRCQCGSYGPTAGPMWRARQ